MKASIHHSEETCRRLSKVQYQKYDITRKAVRWILGGIPIVIGLLFGLDTTIGILFFLFAMFFLYKTANSYESEGVRAFQGTPEAYRHVEYTFHGKKMVVMAGGIEKTVPYDQLYALVEDEHYLYLFLNRNQAHMLDCATIQGGPEQLKAHLSKATGKSWDTLSTKKTFRQTIANR